MPNLKFFINAEELAKEMKDFKVEVVQALEDGVRQLSAMTYAKVTELAQEKLTATRKIYTDNLEYKEVSPGLWVVSLDEPALWIEDGRKSGSMLNDLLRKGAKTSKDGHRYKAIPFDHGKPPSQMDPFARMLVAKVRSELKKASIPFKKLEYTPEGSPRLGKLHTMNISSPYPSKVASHQALWGLNIYQTKTVGGEVKRDIMTFRMASDAHPEKWIHPGRPPAEFFETALIWAEKEFEDNILPAILAKFR
jgi:hypothetical protein